MYFMRELSETWELQNPFSLGLKRALGFQIIVLLDDVDAKRALVSTENL